MSGFVINSVHLSGNLTRDPEHKQVGETATVCRLRIASNERYKTNDGTWQDRPGYYDIDIWRGIGDWAASNLRKGDQIVVEGRLRWREWEAQDGSKRQGISITADSVIPPRGERKERSSDEVPIDTGDLPDVSGQYGSNDDDIPF